MSDAAGSVDRTVGRALHWTDTASRDELEDYCRHAEDDLRAQADELDRLRAERDAAATAERDRLLAIANERVAYEASAAAHHAGRWQEAHEYHLNRHAAMRDLIDALAPNAALCGHREGDTR